MIAYQRFNEINSLGDVVAKHRSWLKDYEGKKYSKGLNGIDLIKWKDTKYSNDKFETDINKVGELKNRLRIEFDDKDNNGTKDKEKIKKHIEYIIETLKKNKWGYIRSTHNGASDYIWVEFTRDLTTIEKKKFLKNISPSNSEIDINFSSYNFCFPVLWAIHWKHSNYREMPVDYYEGEQIDFDSLELNNIVGLNIKQNDEGIDYNTFKVFTRKGQMDIFKEKQKFFYDKAGIFWFWIEKKYCWEIVDEVELLNYIVKANPTLDIITSKTRTEILNSLKQEGRKNIPQDIQPNWIQFLDEIIEIPSGRRFKATSDYFVTNPIPFKISGNPETPTIDKLFEEWVGKDYVKLLHEIIAYCMIPSYPIHRLFCFVGGGLNGKSTYLNLLKRVIGEKNVTCTELDTLLNSRFEITKLHKKLACIMGETNFNQLQKTSVLKRLTGGDMIGFEYKNKKPFDEINYAKILIATNNLPETTDKTIGFYRRWCIIDFPNQFSEKKDVLNTIPEEEYENLMTNCVLVLSDLLNNREFTNEGTIEERQKKYEDKSSFLDKFLKEFTTTEDFEGYIIVSDFNKKFKEWCKENRHREMSETSIGMELKKRGLEQQRKYFDWLFEGKGGQMRCWMGIKWI